MTQRTPSRYEEIAGYIRGLVGDAGPSDRLPSEAELCRRFGVSRMTVRQAVGMLANEGLLVRRPGRGTFVAPRRIPRLLGSPLSFSESMRRRGLQPSSRVIERVFATPNAADVAALELAGPEPVLILERLRLADAVPMAIERAVIHPAVGARLPPDDEMGSLHDAFEALGHLPTTALATVTARLVTESEAGFLDLSDDGVVVCERRIITDQDGMPLEHTESRYAAGRYEFEAVLHRDASEVMG